MTTPAQATDDLFNRLVAGSIIERDQYILTRTPPELQSLMVAKIAAYFPPPLTSSQVTINNNAVIPLQDAFTNVLGTVTARVTGGVMQFVIQALQANLAMINNGGAVIVKNAAGVAVAGSPGAAEVAANVLNDVKLTV